MKVRAAALILTMGFAALPSIAAPDAPPSDTHLQAGAAIYQDNCMACHGSDGSGEKSIFPPLAGNLVVRGASAERLIRVVLAGAQSIQTARAPTGAAMPSFAWRLNDAETADVVTYIRSSWGNQASAVSADMVAPLRARLRKDVGLPELPAGN